MAVVGMDVDLAFYQEIHSQMAFPGRAINALAGVN